MVLTGARWIVGALGVALLGGALFGGSVMIGDPLGPTHLAALMVGTAALAAALAGKRVLSAYGTGAVLVINTILLLAGIELGAAVA